MADNVRHCKRWTQADEESADAWYYLGLQKKNGKFRLCKAIS